MFVYGCLSRCLYWEDLIEENIKSNVKRGKKRLRKEEIGRCKGEKQKLDRWGGPRRKNDGAIDV